MTATLDVLREYIRSEHGYDGPLDEDLDLLAKQILDSFSIVQLVLFVQDKFGVEFDAEELVRDNLSTLGRIRQLVEAKQNA